MYYIYIIHHQGVSLKSYFQKIITHFRKRMLKCYSIHHFLEVRPENQKISQSSRCIWLLQHEIPMICLRPEGSR